MEILIHLFLFVLNLCRVEGFGSFWLCDLICVFLVLQV